MVADLQKSDAQVFQAGIGGPGLWRRPGRQIGPLVEAADVRTQLTEALKGADPREDVVWSLVTGSLDFAIRYASEVAACRMQSAIGMDRYSVQLTGQHDPVWCSTSCSYGERGQLPGIH